VARHPDSRTAGRDRIRQHRPLGPHDILASGITKKTYDRIIDELRAIRGELFVDAYLR
jgi:hypothetical protein